MAVQAQVESIKDFDGDGVDGEQKRWCAELKVAKDYYKDYQEKCKKIVQSYRDERKSETYGTGGGEKRINLLWSNTQTMKPAVLARKPKAIVNRRNSDSNPIASIAAQVLERGISYCIDNDEFDYAMFEARDDYLLLSRGVMRVIFEMEGEREKIIPNYTLWDDFLASPARIWSEVRWVAFRAYMSRDQLVERFGEETGKDIPLTYTSDEAKKSIDAKDKEISLFKQAEIWEIWDLISRKVYWICEQYDKPCDQKDDFLGLHKFFPCPRPAYGVITNNTTVPVPEYELYRDQARAIDNYETRIQALRDAMRVRGFYNAEIQELERLYREASENDLIPITEWAKFASSGGVDGNIVFAPIEPIVAAVIELSNAIEQEKQRIYEVTGISDIIRGVSSPDETLGAQQLKGQFANNRLEEKRREINRFIRDILAMYGEIIAEHYSVNTIMQMADVQLVPVPPPQVDPQTGQPMQAERPELIFPKVYEDEFQQAIDLLRNEPMRMFKIDIETDSTILADEMQEKQAANEMITAVGGFMTQALEVGKSAPMMIPVISEMLLFMLRKYRAGRSLEGVVEQAAEQMQAYAKNALVNPPPNPEMEKVKADQVRGEQEMQLKQQQMQQDIQLKTVEAQHNMQLEQQKMEGTMMLEKYKADLQANTSKEVEGMRGKSQLANTKLGMTKEGMDVDEEGNEVPSPLSQQITMLEQKQVQQGDMLVQGQQQMMQVMMQMLHQLSLPKRVIRDPASGMIVGVETVSEQRPN